MTHLLLNDRAPSKRQKIDVVPIPGATKPAASQPKPATTADESKQSTSQEAEKKTAEASGEAPLAGTSGATDKPSQAGAEAKSSGSAAEQASELKGSYITVGGKAYLGVSASFETQLQRQMESFQARREEVQGILQRMMDKNDSFAMPFYRIPLNAALTPVAMRAHAAAAAKEAAIVDAEHPPTALALTLLNAKSSLINTRVSVDGNMVCGGCLLFESSSILKASPNASFFFPWWLTDCCDIL